MCADITLTTDNKLPLTDQELGYLRQFLDAGDRAGFCMAYYHY